MTDRRDFLKKSAQVAAAVAAANAWKATGGVASAFASVSTPPLEEIPDSTIKELMMTGLTAAKAAGAGYADVRIGRQRQNFVFTREQQIQNVVDTDSMGCGVRALVDGTWGFAATRVLTKDGVAAAAKEAVAIAKANRIARDRPVVLTPAPAEPNGTWKSAFTMDPWDVSVEEKAALLLKANAEALKVKGVKYIFSGLFFVKEERNYANSEGSRHPADRRAHRGRSCRSRRSRRTRPTSRIATNIAAPMGRGWEYVLEQDLVGNAQQWGEEAVAEAHREAGRGGTLRSRAASRRISGSRSTSRSRIPRSSIARWATRPTTPARASSRRRKKCSGSSSTAPSS